MERTDQRQETVIEEITITDQAASEIRRIKTENNIPDINMLRLGVKDGGCSGFSYFLGFDDRNMEGDSVTTINGITVIVDAQSQAFLSGAELDFQNNTDARGFIFKNPNTKHNCGCGSASCS